VLHIPLYNQLIFTVPHLSQVMGRAESLGFSIADLSFDRQNAVLTTEGGARNRGQPLWLPVGCRLASRGVCNYCRHIDWQVSAAAQVSDALVPALSVGSVFISAMGHDVSSEQYNEFNLAACGTKFSDRSVASRYFTLLMV
jgi:hypothetical protein